MSRLSVLVTLFIITLSIYQETVCKQKAELDELKKEMRYLERIEEPEIKVRYSSGKPVSFHLEKSKYY